MKVFVYGTLKSGYGNNRLLSDAKKVSDAVTKKPWWLVDCGFPYMLPEHHEGEAFPVVGEVWEVDNNTLHALDRLEGVEYNHYNRETISVDTENGEEEVFAYVHVHEVYDLPLCKVRNGKYEWGI